MIDPGRLRGTIRSFLYERHKYDLGCPTEVKCHLYQNSGGEKACELCPKHLKIIEPGRDPNYLSRVRFITRVEAMIAVGCKFGPSDLDPETWDHLIVLHTERNWILKKLEDQRKEARDPHPWLGEEGKKALEQHRNEKGIPGPGQSLFSKVKR